MSENAYLLPPVANESSYLKLVFETHLNFHISCVYGDFRSLVFHVDFKGTHADERPDVVDNTFGCI